VRIAAVVAALVLAGCGDNLAPDRGPDLALHDEIFAMPSRDRGVLCAGNADNIAFKLPSILDALDRARDERRIVQLFMHDPGGSVSVAKLEAVLAAADERGLRWVTNRELADGAEEGPGIALGFDDWFIDHWYEQRPLFTRYHAKVTFFVTFYPSFTPQGKVELRTLADDGHDIEYHSTLHHDAPAMVAEQGMNTYLTEDIDRGLDAMRADGYDPVVFAYPRGLRSPELDSVLLDRRFRAVRATTLHCPHMNE
jgi:Polysaccharide deacetylase